MGNSNHREQWAARERLLFIERVAWWRGVVNRVDLRELYGISAAQASADLQSYLELNPGALAYNLSTKRYEANEAMGCVLHAPHLEEAIAMFMGGGGSPVMGSGGHSSAGQVFYCRPPLRQAAPAVERYVFVAVEQGRQLRVNYRSVSGSGSSKWRVIAPHAWVHDGLRWHVRAWCFEHEGFRDFVLTRMMAVEWPNEPFVAPQVDGAWAREVVLVFEAARELDEGARKAIEEDYGMKNGKFKMRVREAVVEYVLAQLRIPGEAGVRPRHLDLVDD